MLYQKKQELSNRKYNLETRKEHTPKEHKAKKKIKLKLKSHFYNKIKSINSWFAKYSVYKEMSWMEWIFKPF